MSFWDNIVDARYAIPSWDGNACAFWLRGQYEDVTKQNKELLSATRTAREIETMKYLGRYDGQWKNGWYEDTEGVRWHSDLSSKDPLHDYGVPAHYFDPSVGQEIVCHVKTDCATDSTSYTWGADLTSNNFYFGII